MKTNIILNGDCLEHMKKLPENSVDAIITDPPYGLEFMGKDWDKFKQGKNIAGGTTGEGTPFGRSKPLNSVYQYDLEQKNQMQNHFFEFGKEALRILKAGGYMLIFGGTRTYHRMTCGIEDAGFEIRDCIMWMYGSGFPKSLNIGKQVDKIQGNEREIVGKGEAGYMVDIAKTRKEQGYRPNLTKSTKEFELTKGNSEWEGWGTALKPAYEPIILARKPLSEKNVALNVLKWGTGGLNIDACRINHNEEIKTTKRIGRKDALVMTNESCGFDNTKNTMASADPKGRFPANIILDEEAGEILDEQSGISKSSGGSGEKSMGALGDTKYGKYNKKLGENAGGLGDKGVASRFFYCAKASKSERNFGLENTDIKEKPIPINEPHNSKSLKERYNMVSKNNHPTVKPINLMEYLIKLVSKEGAIILDPFIGSGTTAIACIKLNRDWIGIEKEPEYIKIANARIKPFLEQRKLK